jgi:hypothetical protein
LPATCPIISTPAIIVIVGFVASNRAQAIQTVKAPARFSLFRFGVFQFDCAPCSQTFARLRDPVQKSLIVFEPVLKPVIFPGLRERYSFHSGLSNNASHNWAFDLVRSPHPRRSFGCES